MAHTDPMKKCNVSDAKDWFEVLQTSELSQIAVMRLAPGQSSGKTPEAHEKSEQVLYLISGELSAEIGSEKNMRMHAGDAVIIPAGIKHKFTNHGETEAVTFNVYSPPEYPPHTRG
jgi:mannose-6-phosphate isomerase-like protein (cupin superfamily)